MESVLKFFPGEAFHALSGGAQGPVRPPLFAVSFSRADEDPYRAEAPVVAEPANDGGAAVGGHRNGPALAGGSNCAGANQFAALLGPHPAAAAKDPRRSGAIVVFGAAHNGGAIKGIPSQSALI